MSDLYPYSSGHRLEDRNTYFYTAFHGKEFIKEYRSVRLEALKQLGPSKSQDYGDYKVDRGVEGVVEDGFDTELLLKSLLGLVSELKSNFEQWDYVDKLTQRFEVAKRVHSKYTKNWSAANKEEYKDLPLYLLFADLVQRAYQHEKKLQYLNVLLKIVDTLIAELDLLDEEQRRYLAGTIELELDHVMSLTVSVGVE